MYQVHLVLIQKTDKNSANLTIYIAVSVNASPVQ
jgi:hypothetical protein